jgi:hypothetical protein
MEERQTKQKRAGSSTPLSGELESDRQTAEERAVGQPALPQPVKQTVAARDPDLLARPALWAESEAGETVSLTLARGVCEEGTSQRSRTQICDVKPECQIGDEDSRVVGPTSRSERIRLRFCMKLFSGQKSDIFRLPAYVDKRITDRDETKGDL